MYTDFDAFTRALLNRINQPELFSASNGILVTELGQGYALGELEISPSSLNPRQIVHGGCICTLMDTVAGIAACSTGRSCVTVNSSTSYFHPLISGKALCRGDCVKIGKTICVVECRVTDLQEQLVSTGTYTFYLKETLGEFLQAARED